MKYSRCIEKHEEKNLSNAMITIGPRVFMAFPRPLYDIRRSSDNKDTLPILAFDASIMILLSPVL